MNYQLYDLQGLDDYTRSLIVNAEIDKCLERQVCSICNGRFIGHKEKDNSICSGKNPLTFAHEFCWKDQERVLE